MALDGRAPKIFRYCTKSGVPLAAFAMTMLFPCLTFLQVSNGSNKVLQWLINLITAGQVITYIVMSITFLFFYYACKAQGLDRSKLPYYGRFQPYSAWLGLVWMTVVVFCYGYSSFEPWSVENFFIYYAMLILAPILYFTWKFAKGTKLVKSNESDLIWERPKIDAYEETFTEPAIGFWREMLQLVGLGRTKRLSDSS